MSYTMLRQSHLLTAGTLLVLACTSVSLPAQDAANPARPDQSPAPSSPAPAPSPTAAPDAPLPPAPRNAAPAIDDLPASPVNPDAPRHYSFEDASLSRVFRILASEAHIDYIEPPIKPDEKISFEMSNLTPFQAFQVLAERRGFRVVQNNGIYELVRDDLRNPNRATVYATRTYALRNTDGRLLFEGVADLLGFTVKPPEGITTGYPKPKSIAASTGLSDSGGGGGGDGDSGGEGKFTSGFPIAEAYADSKESNGAGDAGGANPETKEFAYTDRGNVLVVRTTIEKHRELAAYLERVDRMENAVIVEVKVLSIQTNKQRDIGADWGLFFGRDKAGNPLFSLDLGGGQVPPNNAGGNVGVGGNGFPPNTTVFGDIAAGIVGGFTYSTFGYFLRDFQVAGRIAFLKQNNRIYELSQPTVITKSGVPVTISSLTEEPIQNFTQGLSSPTVVTGSAATNGTSTTALSTSVQTFKYGILLDVLATELRNGYVDLIVTPRISSKIGETASNLPIIQANTTTTTVTVPPGRTVAMGGVMALTETRAIRETPGLSKIPLIGKYLFARNARSLIRTNLIILVTPRIIRSPKTPAIEAGCDEQHLLNLTKSYGARAVGSKNKEGVVRHATVDPADPDDAYDNECQTPPTPAVDGKQILNRSRYP